jgi:RNA polymerase sigma-70 factor (ECF subfamily)
MTPLDVEDIIVRFKKGDARALTYIFKQYHKALCYFATQLVKDEQEARDIVADSFMKLWQRHPHFDAIEKIRSFLYTSTRNACFNHIKHVQRRTVSHAEIAYLGNDMEDYIQSRMIKAELMQKILLEIEALPPIRRKIFKMIYLQDLSIFEIATKLNISVDTVRVQKARALHFLRSTVLRKGLAWAATVILTICFGHK